MDLGDGEKRYSRLRKEEMIAGNLADSMVIYLFTILLVTLLSPAEMEALVHRLQLKKVLLWSFRDPL